ncbi:hypothetical protein P3S68_001743 [Capsicum galapagoense]
MFFQFCSPSVNYFDSLHLYSRLELQGDRESIQRDRDKSHIFASRSCITMSNRPLLR